MALSVQIRKSGVAVVRCTGSLGLAYARDAAETLWQTADWPGVAAVWDFRDATFDVSSSDVRETAEFVLKNQRESPPERMAFVTSSEVDFGLARMFDTFRQDPRTAFRVFRDFDEALAWASG